MAPYEQEPKWTQWVLKGPMGPICPMDFVGILCRVGIQNPKFLFLSTFLGLLWQQDAATCGPLARHSRKKKAEKLTPRC